MPGSISQMQMTYEPEEDRILFRVNSTGNDEFRFWITRRYAGLMKRVLAEHRSRDPDVSTQVTPEARQAVDEWKQEKAIAGANFKDEFRSHSPSFPLGEGALLAFKLTYDIRGQDLHLGIQPKTGKGINMVINRDINTTLSRLLEATAAKAEWGLAEATPVPVQARVVN